MIPETEIVLGGVSHKAVPDPVVVYITPYYGNLTHVYNLKELLFLACRSWHTECSLNIALKAESLGDAVRGNGQSSIDLRRKLPSEH